MKRFLIVLLVIGIILAGFSSSILSNIPKPNKAEAYSWSTNNLASDGGFINIDGLNVAGVQSILNSTGGFLAGFSEGGRSAAQIIVDASHGYGEASGSINGITINTSTGTINPVALLAMLQKEQSLVYMRDRSDGALNAAMGYGCPDGGGCNEKYRGFTNQVEWGAWQLRYNYERASGHGFSDYQVGQTQNIDDVNVTFGNRCTASLYRYTPHLGTNFSKYFEQWGGNDGLYRYQYVTQSTHPYIAPGGSSTLSITLKNTGSTTWTQDVVHLATNRPQDRVSLFTRGSGWISSNRIVMQEASVAPGENATFVFTISASANLGGTYREYFRPVADGITWMNDIGIYWDVTVPKLGESYQYSHVTQSSYPVVNPGLNSTLSLTLKNTGSTTWTQDVVHLATNRPQDRVSLFTRGSGWISSNRIVMQEASVAPGENATFVFTISASANMASGTYREYFRPVADGITWMNDIGIYWDLTILSPQQRYQYSHVTHSPYPALTPGGSSTLSITLKNTGSTTWTQDVVHLATNRPQDRVSLFTRGSGWISSNRIVMQEASVAPGENATFVFTISASANLGGTYREYFRPVADGITWMNDIGIYWDVTVL